MFESRQPAPMVELEVLRSNRYGQVEGRLDAAPILCE